MFLTAEAAEQFENTKAIIVRRRVSFFGNVSFFAFVKRTNERKQYYR